MLTIDTTTMNSDFIFYLGLIYFLTHIIRLCYAVWVFYVRKLFFKEDLITRFGKWAVVTGGAGGLGECYCRELASRGHNVVIIGRNLRRLKEVTKELEQEFKILTKYILADLRGGKDVFEEIERQLEDIDIGILINNAGVMLPYPMTVDEMSYDQVMNHVLVNMSAPTHMCRIMMSRMKARGKGAIINVSSKASILFRTPYTAVYGASKSYLKSLSEAMQFECKDYKNIQVQCLMPALIKTNLFPFTSNIIEFLSANPRVFVRSAVDTIGVANNTSGYFVHQMEHEVINLLSAWFMSYVDGCYKKIKKDEFTQQWKNKQQS